MRAARGLQGCLAFALLLAVALATAWEQQPHGYRPASAPADAFSAERALRVIDEIAQRTHPIGSTDHDRVRDYLAGALRNSGLQTEIRTGIGKWPVSFNHDSVGLGRVQNIVARLPGEHSTGTVYLVAHYDSVPSGPGANDDGSGVAAILETVRALKASGTGLRNDLVVLLTDGEEPGLLGAEAFVADGNYDRDHSVVINHDARGAGGPPLLWRLTRPAAPLIRALGGVVPHPNTDALSTALAGDATTSTTDFSAFQPGGLRVLDWAYAGKSAYYHNRMDDPAHVGLPTLQQLGENTLAQTRAFGQRDLGNLGNNTDRTFFTLPFGTLVLLPVWVIIALAVLMVLALAWVIRQVQRNGDTGVIRVLLAAATALVTVPLAAAATYAVWELLKTVRPAYGEAGVDPYVPQYYQVAMILAAAAALPAWYAFARRVFGPTAAPVGLLTATAVIAAVAAALAPAPAYVLVIPACAATIGVALTFVLPERWRLPLLTLALLPAAVFLGVTVWTGAQAGLEGAPFLVAPEVALLGGLLLLTLSRSWPARRGWTVPAVVVVVIAALAATGLTVDRYGDSRPRVTQLVYALDADHHDARWISAFAPNDWTRTYVIGTGPGAPYTDLWLAAVSSGQAADQALTPPTARILSDSTDSGHRTVRLRLQSPRGAPRIDLHWDDPVQSLRVAGRDITPVPAKGFRFYAPPAEGIEVTLVAPAGPLHLRLADQSWLPDSDIQGFQSPPPDYYFRQDSTALVFTTVPLP